MLTEATRHIDSPSLDAELPLTDSEMEDPDKECLLSMLEIKMKARLDQTLVNKMKARSEKPHKEESGKTNAETEVQSMVSVPIHQDTSLVPPITTPVIDLTMMQSNSPLPTSTSTTSIITTTSLPPPPQPQQSTADPILVSRIGELEQHMADLIQNNLALEERLDKQGTRLYNLENLNIPHKVSQEIDEIVTNAVDWAMQAPLRARFRDLPTVDMKEILQQRMFEITIQADQAEARKKKRMKHAASINSSWVSLPSFATTSTSSSAGHMTNPEGDQVRFDVKKPLPLSGLPGHETIQTHFFFNKDLEYLRYGSKGSSPALLISKMKAARHDSPSRQKDVRTHMWILNVENQSILKIRNLYPSDFEDLNLLLLQGYLDHLLGSDKRMLATAIKQWTRNLVIRQRVRDFQLGIKSYQTQLNLTKPGWDATGYEFKHDYTIIKSPRAVVFPVDNNDRKITRFNEIYKFSDGMLKRILEALDYRVKEFKVKRLNPGMNTRF
ncbi:hypothetical protein Tco_1401030 [Tanacetum coccineum]